MPERRRRPGPIRSIQAEGNAPQTTVCPGVFLGVR